MTFQEWLQRVKTALQISYNAIEKEVLAVDPDNDGYKECKEHWVFEKICGLKSTIENTLAGLDEDKQDAKSTKHL